MIESDLYRPQEGEEPCPLELCPYSADGPRIDDIFFFEDLEEERDVQDEVEEDEEECICS